MQIPTSLIYRSIALSMLQISVINVLIMFISGLIRTANS